MTNIDPHALRVKLNRDEPLSLDEQRSLLAAVMHYQQATAHLASCQAATLESLPRSASKSARQRHADICITAAALLSGDASRIRYLSDPQRARERCEQAATNFR